MFRTPQNGAFRRRAAPERLPVAVRTHDDLNILIELHQEAQQPFR